MFIYQEMNQIMKKIAIFVMPLALFATSCVQNETTGEMEAGWLFWVFLGLIAFLLIFGAFVGVRRKNKNNDGKDSLTRQIDAYEETLEKKEKEEDK